MGYNDSFNSNQLKLNSDWSISSENLFLDNQILDCD